MSMSAANTKRRITEKALAQSSRYVYTAWWWFPDWNNRSILERKIYRSIFGNEGENWIREITCKGHEMWR